MSTRQVNYNINVTGNLEAKVKSATKGFDKLGKEVDGVKKNIGKASGKGGSGIAGAFAGLGPIIAGAFAVDQLIQFGKEVFDITARFQKFEAVLTNTLGSKSEAQKSMQMIQEFAASTPFSVDELSSSFVKLANSGFVPVSEELRKLGDLASSVGKPFDQLVEAVLDAQMGEFERLKEFGIKASKSGNQVSFAFKGVTTTVQNTEDAIKGYLLSLGDAKGVSGAMSAISQTLGGQVSNLGDNFDSLKLAIGDALSEGASTGIGLLNKGISFLTKLVGPLIEAFKELHSPLAEIFKEITSLFGGFGEGIDFVKIIVFYFKFMTSKMRAMGTVVAFLVRRVVELINWIKGLIASVIDFSDKSSFMVKAVEAITDAFNAFIFVWDNLPVILEASWRTMIDFFGDVIDLTKETGQSIFNILKEAFDFSKIATGDFSGIAKAIDDTKKFTIDTSKLSLRDTFKSNLQELLDKGPVSGVAVNASETVDPGLEDEDVDDEVTGTKATNINLNIEKLIETLTFNTSNLAESSTKIKEEVTRVLIEALRDTTAIATN